MDLTNRLLKSYIPTIVWALFILFLSTYGVGLNLPESLWDIIGWDKLAHASVYGILAFLLVRLLMSRRPLTWTVLLWVTIASTAYGVLMEMIQYSFFPNRHFEILDIIANIIGIAISIIFVNYFYIIKKPQ